MKGYCYALLNGANINSTIYPIQHLSTNGVGHIESLLSTNIDGMQSPFMQVFYSHLLVCRICRWFLFGDGCRFLLLFDARVLRQPRVDRQPADCTLFSFSTLSNCCLFFFPSVALSVRGNQDVFLRLLPMRG